VSNPKVFEFAKEVGMTPLALMDKIREWQLPVRSHMAELAPEQLATIKAKLSEGSGEKSETKKKPKARKKAAAKAPAKPTTPTTVAKAAVESAAKAADKESAAASTKASTTVVRRKAKVAEETTEHSEDVDSEVEAEAEVIPEKIEKVASAKVAPAAVEEVPREAAPVEIVAPPATPVVESTPVAPAVAPPAVSTKVDETPERKVVARKKEVAIGNSGVESTPSAATPKRNIIGRMDLSRVQQQAPRGSAPGFGGDRGPRPPMGSAQGGPGARPRPAGNLRAGFVQAAPTPDFIESGATDDFGRKKDEKRRNKGGGAGAEGAVRPAGEGQSATFDAAEFRKREMVFQPKKKKGMLSRPAMQTQITQADASKRVVKVNGTIKVSDAANEMKIKATELIRHLMKNGVMANINTSLDFDTIALIAPEFKYEAISVLKTAADVLIETAFGDLDAERIVRPPVVTVMGHVDHGKTSLLDAIRNTSVTSGEAGGITQHIGAYQVKLEDGQLVTFLDTPGHEAFTAMRARGANATDIAIIVVAADDGVMPQTAEAINHAKAAGVPMIVAVNKIDKPGANTERIKQQLTEYEVVPEEWGGSTIFREVSALKRTGIKELLEQILLVAEVQELKANPKRSGTGIVIESRLERGRGNVATVLVQDGTMSVGQHIVAGTVVGRIRSLMNDRGEKVSEAVPGMPVEVLGLDGTPSAGDKVDVVKDERSAEEVAKIRKDLEVKAENPNSKMSLEDLFSKVSKGDVKELAVVLKCDVAGSMEAIQGMFAKLSTPEVNVKIIHSAIGGISENDVLLASTAKGIIVGFNVRPDGGAQAQAKRQGVEIRTYSIVYELIDDMRKAMVGLLQPDIVEKVMGRAEVRNVFNVPKIGAIAGCSVVDGKILRSNQARLIRDGKIIFEGKLSSLKRFKDDAREVAQGFECGIGIENFNDVKVGDVIEAFIKEEVARELSAPLNP
jgi:translation initiation factor IF-2